MSLRARACVLRFVRTVNIKPNILYYDMFQYVPCVNVCGRKKEYVCVQRLRALFCTGAIKDTLEKERDYRKKKNIITHKWCLLFFYLAEKKTINLCGCEKQQSRVSHDASAWRILQVQRFTATCIFFWRNLTFGLL